jgi:hypothetical protein
MFEEGMSIASTVTARRFTASTGTVKPAEVGRTTPFPAKRTAGLRSSNCTVSSRVSFIR